MGSTSFISSISFLSLVVLIGSNLILNVQGHGRLLEPPGRSTLWRFPEFASKNPVTNWNDNELNCGGFGTQHGPAKGQCGPCGDSFLLPQPRPNEEGGKWGQGIIVREYAVGASMGVKVQLTSNHKGYFQFRLCPHNNPTVPVQDSCLSKYVLHEVGSPQKTRFEVIPGQYFQFDLQLPGNLTCSQCVVQWDYVTGNNWGKCPDGTGRLGCGPQETFRACADIVIKK